MNSFLIQSKTIKTMIVLTCLSVLVYTVGLIFLFSKIKEVEDFYYNSGSESFKQQKFLTIKPIFEANKEGIEILRNLFIKKNDEVGFINQLESLAKKSQIKFEILNIDVEKKEGLNFESLNVQMNIEGNWNDVVAFVYKLEKMDLALFVDKISLDKLSSGSWSGVLEFSVFREI